MSCYIKQGPCIHVGGGMYRVWGGRREKKEGWTHLLTEFTISSLQFMLDMSAVLLLLLL